MEESLPKGVRMLGKIDTVLGPARAKMTAGALGEGAQDFERVPLEHRGD